KLTPVQDEANTPVLIVAVHCGQTKPHFVGEFQSGQFVDELNELQESGVLINEKNIGVVSFNAVEGCLKCVAQAKKAPTTNRMCYVGSMATTDRYFKANAYPNHVKWSTPLTSLKNFDIVKSVVMSEPLNLFHYGIMRKLLTGWQRVKFGKQAK
uniref:Uncharacterized protein n=1 Tax=Anopheles stephensi TaxID=30069 RepID=A0A182YT76_ANOST